MTTIPVPTGKKFEVSGTNVNGFIVTVYKNENTEQPITEPTTVPEEESTGESETSESTESAEITENTEVTKPPTAYVAGQ